jgi:hypothetical protein
MVVKPNEPFCRAYSLPGILLVADTDQGRLQQPNDRGEHLLARQARPGQVPFGPGADARQGLAKGNQPIVLGLIAHFAPARVIAVLFSATLIVADRLKMAVRVGTDPDIGPGRRNGQRSDAMQRLGPAHELPVGIAITKASAVTDSANAGCVSLT